LASEPLCAHDTDAVTHKNKPNNKAQVERRKGKRNILVNYIVHTQFLRTRATCVKVLCAQHRTPPAVSSGEFPVSGDVSMRTRTKTISLALLGVIASGGTSHNELRAQDAPKGDAPQQGQQRRRGPLMRILTELNLTDAQKAQIEPLVKEAQAQSRTVRQDNNLSREESAPNKKKSPMPCAPKSSRCWMKRKRRNGGNLQTAGPSRQEGKA
jgi:hypothetical protein